MTNTDESPLGETVEIRALDDSKVLAGVAFTGDGHCARTHGKMRPFMPKGKAQSGGRVATSSNYSLQSGFSSIRPSPTRPIWPYWLAIIPQRPANVAGAPHRRSAAHWALRQKRAE